jgi:beta-xylosidase
VGVDLTTATLQSVDQVNGNAAVAWRAMGSPDYLTAAQVASLNAAATLPSTSLTPVRISGSTIQLDLPNIAGNSLSVITVVIPRQ